MTSLRSLTSVLLATAALVVAGCGGGEEETPPTPVQVDSARTARASLGPAGGTVVATAADGRRYTLTVAPGALDTATEITATPVESLGAAPLAAGLKAAVRFAPSGLRFKTPATLRIDGAGTGSTNGKVLVGFLRSDDGTAMQLQPPVLAGNALELAVPHFSDAGVAEASPQDLAAVPPAAAGLPATEVISDLFMRDLPIDPTPSSIIALFVGLHDTQVAPRLAAAEAGSQSDVHEAAVAAFFTWNTLMLTVTSEAQSLAQLVAGLDGRVERARARAVALLQADLEAGVLACLSTPPDELRQLGGLFGALQAQLAADVYGLDDAASGLDADTVARRLNACARVAFDPLPLPALVAGRSVSLDARVNLLFAEAPNQPGPVAFAFTVSSGDASIATPTGLSDVLGNYTTVVTPRTQDAAFAVRACVLASLSDGVNRPSALCGQQTLAAAPASVVLSGEVRFFGGGPTSPSRPLIGSVRLRLRAELDGKFTVLEALGNTRVESTGTTLCFPSPADGTIGGRDVTTRFVSSSTITGGIQNDFLNAGKFIGFLLTGSTVIVNDKLLADCSVVTETQRFTNAGSVQILSIERDAQNQPLVIVMGDSTGSQEGRLVRE